MWIFSTSFELRLVQNLYSWNTILTHLNGILRYAYINRWNKLKMSVNVLYPILIADFSYINHWKNYNLSFPFEKKNMTIVTSCYTSWAIAMYSSLEKLISPALGLFRVTSWSFNLSFVMDNVAPLMKADGSSEHQLMEFRSLRIVQADRGIF